MPGVENPQGLEIKESKTMPSNEALAKSQPPVREKGNVAPIPPAPGNASNAEGLEI
jgi:hypothetical protein